MYVNKVKNPLTRTARRRKQTQEGERGVRVGCDCFQMIPRERSAHLACRWYTLCNMDPRKRWAGMWRDRILPYSVKCKMSMIKPTRNAPSVCATLTSPARLWGCVRLRYQQKVQKSVELISFPYAWTAQISKRNHLFPPELHTKHTRNEGW